MCAVTRQLRIPIRLISAASAIVGTFVLTSSGAMISSSTPAAAASGSKCSSSSPVSIGVDLSLSGSAATIGKTALDGVKLAQKQIDSRGGIHGKCISLVVKDDAANPTTSEEQVRQLIESSHVSALVGPLLSANSAAVLSTVTQGKVLEASIGTPPQALDPSQSPYTYVFGTSGPSGAAAFATCVTNAGIHKVAVLAVNNTLGADYQTALKAIVKKYHLTVTGSQLENLGSTSLTTQMQALKSGNPDAVLMFVTGSDINAAIAARNDLAWNVPLIGFSPITGPNVAQAVGTSGLGMNRTYGSGFSPNLTHTAKSSLPTSKAGVTFIKDLQKYFDQKPLQDSAVEEAPAYDALNMIAKGFNGSKSLNSDAARKYLDKHGFDGVQGHYQFTSKIHIGLTGNELTCVSAIPTSFKDGTYQNAGTKL